MSQSCCLIMVCTAEESELKWMEASDGRLQLANTIKTAHRGYSSAMRARQGHCYGPHVRYLTAHFNDTGNLSFSRHSWRCAVPRLARGSRLAPHHVYSCSPRSFVSQLEEGNVVAGDHAGCYVTLGLPANSQSDTPKYTARCTVHRRTGHEGPGGKYR
jgi:hypothetical protein